MLLTVESASRSQCYFPVPLVGKEFTYTAAHTQTQFYSGEKKENKKKTTTKKDILIGLHREQN